MLPCPLLPSGAARQGCFAVGSALSRLPAQLQRLSRQRGARAGRGGGAALAPRPDRSELRWE